MNKKIEFDYNNKHYVLEYDRNSVRLMESQGFSLNELSKKPMLMIPLAFEGLFIKNHRTERKATVDEIYEHFKDKDKLLVTISEMLSETYATLNGDTEGQEGNIDWEVR